jgi:signal transduction histidine kinase
VGRVGALVAALLGGTAVALFTQWPAFDDAPALAVVNTVVTVAFVLTGTLMARFPEQRSNGRLLALSGIAWSGVWLDGWDVPLLSMVALFCPAPYVTAAGAVLLRYPRNRLLPQERVFIAAVGLWLTAIYLGSAFTPGMTDVGHLGSEPYRPPALLPAEAASVIRTADWVGSLVLAAIFIVLLTQKARRARGLDRGELVPVFVGAVATGVSMLLYRIGKMLAESHEGLTELRLLHALSLLAVPVAFAGAALRRRLERGAVADVVVGLSGAATAEEVRDRLRTALRDPSLEVLYWVPEEESYVSTAGQLVPDVPEQDTADRLVVPVRASDGGRLALVLADTSLRRHGRPVSGAVSAAGLALENARLQAGIRAQLEQVRASRARIVEAGLAERRRLERDLHDGAQQRLVALSLELGMLEAKLGDDPDARRALGQARGELSRSLEELRELARGIHPAVLTGHGLEVALDGLATRAPVPVRLRVDVAGELPEAVEVAAYFLVSESLTNVAKYAHASTASVDVVRANGDIVIDVADDGVGGADAAAGSGLRGLADRVEALGGRLRVTSPAGDGTRLHAEIPCG